MTDNINNNVSTGSTMLNVDITRYLQQQLHLPEGIFTYFILELITFVVMISFTKYLLK